MFSREYPKGGGTVIGLDLDWVMLLKMCETDKFSSEMKRIQFEIRPTTNKNTTRSTYVKPRVPKGAAHTFQSQVVTGNI